MYDFDSGEDDVDDDELEPRVKYADILQKEEYVGEEEDGPVPYIDDGPGYYFFLGIE